MTSILKRLLFWGLLLTTTGLTAQIKGDYPARYFNKQEVYIEMRDGVKLFTVIYTPKDTSRAYPILMKRTPYSCRPYGKENFPEQLGPSKYLMQDGYIFVYQDVRGRWMSEGAYDNMRPHIPNKRDKEDIDESSDTYDTVEWLTKNVGNFNGNVGVWGISYPGFYATTSAVDAHPAVKAVSPQACIGDFYFDDFHHNGAYILSYWRITALFGYQTLPTMEPWYTFPDIGTPDQYQFFLDIGPLKNLDKYYDESNFFWRQLKEHPDYDAFWQKRNIVQHLGEVRPAMMIVGGWFDAEDLYGPLNTYQAIEERNPDTYNTIVMGPWSHGDWARDRERQMVSNVFFGTNISDYYQYNLERPFFNYWLKGEGSTEKLPEAMMFDTGAKEWTAFDTWPPEESQAQTWYLNPNKNFSTTAQARKEATETFISDPDYPVPYSEDIAVPFTPRKYMADDQRFAARRPDVLVFETPVLEEDLTLAGPILAKLKVATTGTDADWVVKVVDVFPPDHEEYEETQDHLSMGNYHMMVRSEVMRGRYRNSFEKPAPFEPNATTAVDIKLQDVYHTFKKGHKLQIQVQSTWFPLIDRNPQTFVENIFKADAEDFQKQTHTVVVGGKKQSTIQLPVYSKE